MNKNDDYIVHTKFILTLPKHQIEHLYPDLFYQWIDYQRQMYNQVENQAKYIKFDYNIMIPKQNNHQNNNKNGQVQKQLILLCKITRKSRNFHKKLATIQFLSPKYLKNYTQNKYQENSNINKDKFIQNNQTLIQSLLKNQPNIIVYLQLKDPFLIKLNQKEFFTNYLISINKRKSNKLNQQLIGQEINLVQKLIEKIQFFLQKTTKTLQDSFHSLKLLCQKDHQVNNFLKNFKNYDSFQDTQKTQQSKRLLLNSIENQNEDILHNITHEIFDFFILLKNNQNDNQPFNDSINYDELKITIHLNINQIETTSLCLKSIFHFIYEKAQGVEQRCHKVVQKMIIQLKNKIFNECSQVFSKFLQQSKIILIKEHFNFQQPKISCPFQKNIQKYQFQSLTPSTQSNYSSQMEDQTYSRLNDHISPINLQQKTQKDIQLSVSDSKMLLQDFYKKIYLNLSAIIKSKKRLFFNQSKTQQNKDIEFLYRPSIQWIPLKTQHQNKYSFITYISQLILDYFEISFKKSIKTYKNQIQNQQSETKTNPVLIIYNEHLNIFAFENFSFLDIHHFHIYLKHIKPILPPIDNRWTQFVRKQQILLTVKTNKKYRKKMKFQKSIDFQTKKSNIIKIPIRGMYCQHLDFYDLQQVYQDIYPQPYCDPQSFQCPRCLIQISFHQIVYLNQFQLLIQYVQLFYLQNKKFNSLLYQINTRQMINNKRSNLSQVQYNQEKNMDDYDKHSQVHLSQCIMQVNHQTQQMVLKIQYLICEFSNLSTSQSYQTKNAQQILPSQFYNCLMNRNISLKSNKKLARFIGSYGKNKKIHKMQKINTKIMHYDTNDRFDHLYQNQYSAKMAHQLIDIRRILISNCQSSIEPFIDSKRKFKQNIQN